MKISPSMTFAAVLGVTALIGAATADHLSFMRRSTGVMTTEAAASIGLPDVAGPWFHRVWFAPVGDGTYEVRPAAVVLGVMPFTSWTTRVDLREACKRLGDACEAV